MSDMWAMAPAKPTIRPRWKMGAASVRSGRWPVPIQGSLLMMTSPGCRVAAGYLTRNACTDIGRVPMKEGTLRVACTTARPVGSSSMQV